MIGNYIVDFFITELGLIFEIDGESHETKGEHDLQRENYLVSIGLEVIHFTDLEIKKDMDSLCERVLFAVKNRFKELQLVGGLSTPSA